MAEERASFTPNEYIILCDQVEGVCPKCLKFLIREKKKQRIKDFELAHIYPLNATDDEIEELKNEEILSDDLNSLDNLIPLCFSCHKIFDRPRTKEEYRELVKLKKIVIKKQIEKNEWALNPLSTEVSLILVKLQESEIIDESIKLSLDPKTIDDKTNETLSNVTKRMIRFHNSEYYYFIKNKHKEIDSIETGISEIIATQVKLYYQKMMLLTKNQQEIYDSLVRWVKMKSQSSSDDACKIIVSYYVQNCEVF